MLELFMRLLPYEWLGACITAIRYILIVVFRSDEKKVQILIDRINQEAIKDGRYNRFVIENPELLDIRVVSEIDSAISDYTRDQNETMIEAPSYSEELDGETLLGGEMRLSAPFLTNNEDEL